MYQFIASYKLIQNYVEKSKKMKRSRKVARNYLIFTEKIVMIGTKSDKHT